MVCLYGLHACRAALLNPQRVITKIWLTDSVAKKESFPLQRFTGGRQPPVRVVDKRELDGLVPQGAVHQGVVLEAKPLPNYDLEELRAVADPALVVVLDQVTDPQNVGSILRLCRVFGVAALVSAAAHAPAETGAMAKVASGALEVVPRSTVANLAQAIRRLKSFGFWCVGLAEGGTQSLRAMQLRGKIALILGSEGHGMRALTESLCDFKAFLPTSPDFSTLNVTAAAAISLYEVFSQNMNIPS